MRRALLVGLLILVAIVGIRIGSDLIYANDPKPVIDLVNELFSSASNKSVLFGAFLIMTGFIQISLIAASLIVAYFRYESYDREDTEAHDIEEELTRLGSPPFDPKKTDG